jgi:hypothetical protein
MTEDGMSNTEIEPLHPNSYKTQEIWQTIPYANLKIQSPFCIIINGDNESKHGKSKQELKTNLAKDFAVWIHAKLKILANSFQQFVSCIKCENFASNMENG